MIIVDKPNLKFLMAGRVLTVEVPDTTRYRKGRTYALGITSRNTTCHVEVIEITDPILKIRLPQTEKPVLLAQRSHFGYVEIDPEDPNLSRAMFAEPEPVKPAEIDRLNLRRRERMARFRGDVIATVDELSEHASAVEARRLRNLRRIAEAL